MVLLQVSIALFYSVSHFMRIRGQRRECFLVTAFLLLSSFALFKLTFGATK